MQAKLVLLLCVCIVGVTLVAAEESKAGTGKPGDLWKAFKNTLSKKLPAKTEALLAKIKNIPDIDVSRLSGFTKDAFSQFIKTVKRDIMGSPSAAEDLQLTDEEEDAVGEGVQQQFEALEKASNDEALGADIKSLIEKCETLYWTKSKPQPKVETQEQFQQMWDEAAAKAWGPDDVAPREDVSPDDPTMAECQEVNLMHQVLAVDQVMKEQEQDLRKVLEAGDDGAASSSSSSSSSSSQRPSQHSSQRSSSQRSSSSSSSSSQKFLRRAQQSSKRQSGSLLQTNEHKSTNGMSARDIRGDLRRAFRAIKTHICPIDTEWRDIFHNFRTMHFWDWTQQAKRNAWRKLTQMLKWPHMFSYNFCFQAFVGITCANFVFDFKEKTISAIVGAGLSLGLSSTSVGATATLGLGFHSDVEPRFELEPEDPDVNVAIYAAVDGECMGIPVGAVVGVGTSVMTGDVTLELGVVGGVGLVEAVSPVSVDLTVTASGNCRQWPDDKMRRKAAEETDRRDHAATAREAQRRQHRIKVDAADVTKFSSVFHMLPYLQKLPHVPGTELIGLIFAAKYLDSADVKRHLKRLSKVALLPLFPFWMVGRAVHARDAQGHVDGRRFRELMRHDLADMADETWKIFKTLVRPGFAVMNWLTFGFTNWAGKKLLKKAKSVGKTVGKGIVDGARAVGGGIVHGAVALGHMARDALERDYPE